MADIINQKITLNAQTAKLVAFINCVDNHFFSISKSTPWPDDSNPPIPSDNPSNIEDVIIYKRVSLVKLAKEVSCPTSLDIKCESKWYRTYFIEDILDTVTGSYTIHPTHVYVASLIQDTDYPTQTFRIAALHTNITLKSGVVNNKRIYTPQEVDKQGIIQWIAYSTPLDKIPGKAHKLEFLIKL